MITPTLRFKQQQNIAQSHFFPYRYSYRYLYSLRKKVGQLRIYATKLLVNQIGKDWQDLERTRAQTDEENVTNRDLF
jgi:hypothetical protein